ncbi:hypothetical protein J3E72DRAFT_175570, partial [Bipolaris maydis]
LPPPIQSEGQTVYNVAVFHQLHCLHALAEEFNDMIATIHAGAARGTKIHQDRQEHIEHCLAYLKESLVCCGDTAFEGQSSKSELPSTSGFGSYHVCKNFDEIMSWSFSHRLND